MLRALLVVSALGLIVLAVKALGPDVRRYFRIRQM
jgi:hypothetical protein